MPLAATCMQFKIILLSEVNHKEKFKHNMVLPVESKLRHQSTYLQNKNKTHRQRTDLWLPMRKRVSGGRFGSFGLADAH